MEVQPMKQPGGTVREWIAAVWETKPQGLQRLFLRRLTAQLDATGKMSQEQFEILERIHSEITR
jgi:hypothetical protein